MAEQSDESSLAGMIAEIVSAYVSHNQIAAADLAPLITAVAGALGRIGAEPEPQAEAKPVPAVPVRRSIRPDRLVCLVCAKEQKLLKRHLAVEHGFTPDQYRRAFDLAPDYPMAAPNYREQRRELALSIGLGRPKKPERKARKSPRAAKPKPTNGEARP